MKKGSLVCVGSGIKSIGHLTLETQGWIKQADLVAYCVADPATEIWIKQNARAHFDLYTLYGNDKRRIDTYNEMVNVMVENARAGKDVCGVFYGHPGIFVLPTHKAISILREEGYKAAMLPGISALDCLFADIGVDPAMSGCQTIEATDLLLRRRPLLTDSHVVIWQIGCVGDLGFRFAGYDNRNFGVFIDYLLEFYEPTQPVVHYTASQFPVCAPICEKMTINDLREANITGISTLYISPATQRPTDSEMAQKMGLRIIGEKVPRNAQIKAKPKTAETPENRPKYIRDVPIKGYVRSKECSGLAKYIEELVANPKMLAEFNTDPETACLLYAEMTDDERKALLSRHPGRIRIALKAPDYPEIIELDKLFDSARATA